MIRINLLPPTQRPQPPTRVRGGLLLVLGLICLVVLMGGLWLHLKSQIANLNHEISQLEVELKRYAGLAQEVEKYKADKKILQEKLASIDRLKAGQVGPVHMLDEVSRYLPRQVWLTSLVHTSNRLTIQGYSFTNFAIAQFMDQLAKAPDSRFSTVDLSYSEHSVVGKVPVEKFEIICTVKL